MALDKGRPQRLWTRLVTRASSDDNTHTTKRRAHASTPPDTTTNYRDDHANIQIP